MSDSDNSSPSLADTDAVVNLLPEYIPSPIKTYAASEPSSSPKRKQRLTEIQQLQLDTKSFLQQDPTQSTIAIRQTRSKKSLYHSATNLSLQPELTSNTASSSLTSNPSEEEIQRELEEDKLNDLERSLYVLFPGQTVEQKKAPTRNVFEYAYQHHTDSECRRFLTDIQPWIQFRRKYKREDLSLPILDKTGTPTQTQDSLPEALDTLPTNQPPKSASAEPLITQQQQSQSLTTSTTYPTDVAKSSTQSGAGGSSPPDKSSINKPHTSPTTSPENMATLRERATFFPSDTFDGTDKSKTRSHIQSFDDFLARQKINEADPGGFNEIKEYFLMTLRGLPRDWLNTQTFESWEDLKGKFLKEYSPYGKTPREWLKHWLELKFTPESDNIDAFVIKLKELGTLLDYPKELQLRTFQMAMPPQIEAQIKHLKTLEECLQEAKDNLAIYYPTVLTSKFSVMSIQPPPPRPPSRSPSPRNRSPVASPSNSPRQSRPRHKSILRSSQPNYRQNFQRGQSLSRDSFQNRNRYISNQRFRSRSQSRNRPFYNRFRPNPFNILCYICNRPNHMANTCRFRFQNRNPRQGNRFQAFTNARQNNPFQSRSRNQQPRFQQNAPNRVRFANPRQWN